MSTLGETVKEHPKATAGFVVVAVVILYLLFHSGSASSVPVSYNGGTDVAAAQGAYETSVAAQQQSNSTNAALQANSDNNSAQLAIAGISGNVTNHANELQSSISLAQINAAQQVQALDISTKGATDQASINAAVAQTAINAQTTQQANVMTFQLNQSAIQNETERSRIAAKSTLDQTQLVSNALVAQSNNQTAINLASIAAQSHAFDVQSGAQTHALDVASQLQALQIHSQQEITAAQLSTYKDVTAAQIGSNERLQAFAITHQSGIAAAQIAAQPQQSFFSRIFG